MPVKKAEATKKKVAKKTSVKTKTTAEKTTKNKKTAASSDKTAAKPRKTASKSEKALASAQAATYPKACYFFGNGKAEGKADMFGLLGSKGAGLAEMTNAGMPVPPGFTITTEACNLFYDGGMTIPAAIETEMETHLNRLEKLTGKKLGDPTDPLLVSVRSGASAAMPGMMDTILNLGLNEESVQGLAKKTGNERFALDTYRRFIQMFGDVVLGIDSDLFETAIVKRKKEKRIRQDSSLQPTDLKDIIKKFRSIVKRKSGEPFPDDPLVQLKMARDAIFRSWNNPRVISYRRLRNIDSSIGTATTVQAMVFGNLGRHSGTGVASTRNPETGENKSHGKFLVNAQGEDVLAGPRTPQPLTEFGNEMPKANKQLKTIIGNLEKHYRDIQDIEFTVQDNELFMLQTRLAERTAQAAIKIAVDMVREKMITREEALLRINPAQLDRLLHPNFAANAKYEVLASGLAASAGAVTGHVAFESEDVVRAGSKNATILVRQETTPDDIEGMNTAVGILTSHGGMTSHAAVVARGLGKCCVSGADALRVNAAKKIFQVGRLTVKEGDTITLNGSTGEIVLGKVETVEPDLSGEFAELMKWADEIRTLGVRANADIQRDAKQAVKYGAEGIGLCRTEHMFFAEDRLPYIQKMILADSVEERQEALAQLQPLQKKDFKGLLDAMEGHSVMIRTLDPALHEFLPKRPEVEARIAALDKKDDNYEEDLEELEKTLSRLGELVESNPMLGHRGCRLGIFYPEITEMQVRAILEAAGDLQRQKKDVVPEIMIPLVGHVNEFKHQKEVVDRIAREVTARKRSKILNYAIGALIELPRAAVTADQIAEEAEFFSFGTDDLTQMTMGFSRDDSSRVLNRYVETGILSKDPFVTIDADGVGQLILMGTEKGRSVRPDLQVGVCGEHGGDPDSIEFCHLNGIDYVSCSPYRVPIARLAAAQAAIKHPPAKKKKTPKAGSPKK